MRKVILVACLVAACAIATFMLFKLISSLSLIQFLKPSSDEESYAYVITGQLMHEIVEPRVKVRVYIQYLEIKIAKVKSKLYLEV